MNVYASKLVYKKLRISCKYVINFILVYVMLVIKQPNFILQIHMRKIIGCI